MDALHLIDKLFLPLARILLFISFGLIVANVLEALGWSRGLARLARPLARLAHLSETSAAAFAVAFISPASASAILSVARKKNFSFKELVTANLFNSLPVFLVHFPSVFFLCFGLLGKVAFIYTGLTLIAAVLRTTGIVIYGHIFLPIPAIEKSSSDKPFLKKRLKEAVLTTLRQFKKRISRVILYTVPVYCLMFVLQQVGFFQSLQEWLINHGGYFSFIRPETIGIVAFSIVMESGAAFSSAASLLHSGALATPDVIIALLVGNMLSTPVRAIRHQLPSYSGFFSPYPALILVCVSQSYRFLSLALVGLCYYIFERM